MPLKCKGMIQKIQISDPSIAEEVRKQMSVAEGEEKGLATKFMANSTYKKTFAILPGESVDIISSYALVTLAHSASGSGLFFFHANSYVPIAETGTSFSFLNDSPGKIAVVSKGENAFSVKNNHTINVVIDMALLKTKA